MLYNKPTIALMLFIISLTFLNASDIKHAVRIKEIAYPFIPYSIGLDLNSEEEDKLPELEFKKSDEKIPFSLLPTASEISYTLTCKNPFGLQFLGATETSFWYHPSTPYLAAKGYVEIGGLIQSSLIETKRIHLDLGFGTALSFVGDDIPIPLITKIKGDLYLWKDILYLSAVNRFYLYGEGLIYQTELPLTAEFWQGKIVLDFGPGYNYGYSWVTEESAWSYTMNLGLAFRWGGKL